MKNYFLYTLGFAFLILAFSCSSQDENRKVIHFITDPRELTATIKIPDFNDSLKIMQITDTHISIEDEKESDFMIYAERMHKAYNRPIKHFMLDTSKTTFDYLDELLLKAKNENVDLLLLTGDIVNFPSAASVKYVYDKLTDSGIPWLYVSGNHDWYYEGMPGSPDSLRITWINSNLAPLYNNRNPLFYSEIVNGINFVGIDNSTYKVNNEQIQFVREQLSRNEPIILISHIPYSLNRDESQPGTTALVDLISSNTNKIIAIFTGHTHRTSLYFTGNLCQYNTHASAQGGCCMVNILSD
jgi:predicted MPP superfamily phosphohydrolase